MNADCRRVFSVVKGIQDRFKCTNVDSPASNASSQAGPPRPPTDLLTVPASGSVPASRTSAPDEDLLRRLRRFRLQLVMMKKRRATQLQNPPLDTSSMPASITLHPILAFMCLNFDVTRSFAPNSNPPLSSFILSEPATAPPLAQPIVHCESFPVYSITIRSGQSLSLASSPSNVSKGNAISVTDILKAIQSAIYEPLRTEQWTALDIDQKRKVSEAFDKRCTQAGTGQSDTVRKMGPKRVDWMVAMRCIILDGLTGTIVDMSDRDHGRIECGYRFRADRVKSEKYGQNTRLLKSRNIW